MSSTGAVAPTGRSQRTRELGVAQRTRPGVIAQAEK